MPDPKSQDNGHADEPETTTQYTPVQDDVWAKEEGDDLSLTDSQAVRDEIDGDEDDQSDNRN